MTVVPTSPRPKTSVISGVIATSGTERTSTATGSTVCSTPGTSTKATATATAATKPGDEADAGVGQGAA